MVDKLVVLDEVEHRLADIQDVDEAREIRDRAEALRVYAKSARKGLAVQNHCARIKILAEIRAGELLREMEKQTPGEYQRLQLATVAPSYRDLGIEKTAAHRWQTMAEVPWAEIQRLEVELTGQGEELTSTLIYAEAREAIRSRKRKRRKEEILAAEPRDDATIILGDFREILPKIAESSFDMILTDPPYGENGLSLWPALAEEGARVLRPGSYLLTYAPHEYLPTILEAMQAHLSYYWTFAVAQTGGEPRVWKKSLWVGWKPVLAFFKGPQPKAHEWIRDLHQGKKGEKDLHPWAQGEGEAAYFIEAFTEVRDTVLDPMCGTGTVLRAALSLGRQPSGIEKDRDIYEVARRNVSEED